ncbi:hypothetical protein [Aquimarina algiphila]|uniref:hypothetical protein n=1 Tax=Aquimarina algiphila TaxID=2047982 RepID=UPI002330ED31|nr:hypothetical protein [Aquimarina algiphila]
MINKQGILEYIEKIKCLSLIEQFNNKIENEEILIDLDERPQYTIAKDHIGQFFYDYYCRCTFLSSLISVNVDDEIDQMIKFIKGETDTVNTYHFSLSPQKTNNDLDLGNYFLIQLNEDQFQNLIQTHHSFGHQIERENYPSEYRALLISKVIAKRKQGNQSHHLWFDRLDEIYTYHSIIRFLLKYFAGNIQSADSSISSDNFPFASSSGSGKVFKNEITSISDSDKAKIIQIIDFLSDKLVFRLIVRSEISCKNVFEQAVFLRSILDPILSKNNTAIRSTMVQGDHKTTFQAKFILKTLVDNACQYHNLISESLLKDFLKIRNSIIHPNPTDGIEHLHLLYDRIHDIRKVIYEFLFCSIELKQANNFDDFELNTQL